LHFLRLFFFSSRRRHTRFSRDWSSDVCSSDLSSIEDIIEDARNGRPYILVDAEDRENEGDIVIPAQFATPEQINFMIRYARGLVCLAMTAERAKQLRLPPMAAENRESMGTAFTISIEAIERKSVVYGKSVYNAGLVL